MTGCGRLLGKTFVMAGGGSGGHVIPLLAVAQELRTRGHECVFIGTRTGFEARLVPPANFQIEYIEIGGLKRVGNRRRMTRVIVGGAPSIMRIPQLTLHLCGEPLLSSTDN